MGACGGSVHATSADAGARAGGGGTITDASQQPVMTTPKKVETVADACQAMCDRLAGVDCMKPTCVDNCKKALVLPVCSDAYVKFLSCALSVPFVCDNGVADLMGACAPEKDVFTSCRMGVPTMPPPDTEPPPDKDPPPVVEPPPIPTYDGGRTTACAQIPLLPENAMCFGTGGVADAGADGEEIAREQYPSCSRSCVEGPNVWTATCQFGKCNCRFNGESCTCAQRPYECSLDCCF